MRMSSAYDVGNTVCGCPAAAQITSYFSSHVSTRVLIGRAWPTGATPPMAWPVHSRTERASARPTDATPISEATRDVSTRCAPLTARLLRGPVVLEDGGDGRVATGQL
jgi:hypothetical protein